jgi:long-chain acyl-CoA synthetase
MIDDHDVTLMADFPPILSMLLDAKQQTGSSWESLKYVVGLDAPDTIQRLYEESTAKFWTGFGQSETSGLVTFVRTDKKPGATGKPLPLVRLRCVDDYENDVAAGETGEIVVQGPIVLKEYWRDPGATEYAFRDGWHHTGDLGRLDDQGYLYYAGRKPEKDLIKSGGENIYPVEVERAIQELPQVSAVCVIGVADEKWGEAVKAVVELAPGETITPEKLTSYVADKIASYKKPRHVVFVDSLPRTPGGEIDRLEVKARYSNH